jgi:hypothetical protein
MQTAMQTADDENEAQQHFSKAAEYYLKSAEMFPQDFLVIALEAYWQHGTALQVTLPLCKHICEGLAKVTYIWEARLKCRSNLMINQCLELKKSGQSTSVKESVQWITL